MDTVIVMTIYVVIWLLIVCFVLWGWQACKALALWIGRKLADFGGGGPR